MKYFFIIYSKVNQFIYLSLFIKFQCSGFNGFCGISLTRENAQIYKGPLLMKYFYIIYSKSNQVIYLSLPINLPSFKALAPTVFEIFF